MATHDSNLPQFAAERDHLTHHNKVSSPGCALCFQRDSRTPTLGDKFFAVVDLHTSERAGQKSTLARSEKPASASLTPEVVDALAAECDRVGALWEHVDERMKEAETALHAVGAPYSPETTNPLYYPLLFLLKSVEAYHRDER